MASAWNPWRAAWLGLIGTAWLLATSAVWAGDRAHRPLANSEEVDVFAGMQQGLIDVQWIAKDSRSANIVVTNRTDRPLSIKFPEAVGAVPVLAQGAAPRAARSGGAGGGAPQATGGGMGGGGMGGAGGGGMMNIAPEKVGQVKIATVCLEHGKAEPRPTIKYEMKPLAEINSSPEVYEVCSMLGTGEATQRVAQAAAWHYTNKLTWEQLAAKTLRSFGSPEHPYFSPDEIRASMAMATKAMVLAQQRQAANKTTTAASQEATASTSQDPKAASSK